MKTTGSLLYSEEPSTGFCPKPHINQVSILSHFFLKISFNFLFRSMKYLLSSRCFLTETPHAFLISCMSVICFASFLKTVRCQTLWKDVEEYCQHDADVRRCVWQSEMNMGLFSLRQHFIMRWFKLLEK